MTWTITFPDRRPRDGQNYMEHLADCLEMAGVLANDRLLVHEVRETMPNTEKPGWVDVSLEELP
jgi:Holliday junction resolvase RusA-like endonuclease